MKTDSPLTPTQYFANNDNFHLCCCHVRNWTLAIGILEIVSLFINVLGVVGCYIQGASSLASMLSGIAGFCIGLVIVTVLIEGVKREKHRFLLPHMVMQVNALLDNTPS